MKFFGWKSAGRASARPVLSRVYGAPASWGEWPRSYEAQVREGYPHDSGDDLVVRDAPGTTRMIPEIAVGAAAEGERARRTTLERRSSAEVPRRLALGYYEIERDYQPGVQAARREAETRRQFGIELPAALAATDAKAIVEARLSSLHAARRQGKCFLPWRYLDVAPGDLAVIAGETGTWRVTSASLARGTVELGLEGVGEGALAGPADPGRITAEADLPEGPTSLILADLPPLGDDRANGPQIAVAAAGVSPGWRRAALLSSVDGGASWQDAGQTAAPAIMGRAITVLGAGATRIVDRIGAVDVELLNASMQLADADGAALLRGANMALLGAELIQYGRALPIGDGVWRLSELLRGRRGTEAGVAGHAADEPFLLLEADALAGIAPVAIGQELHIWATGLGDAAPAEATATVVGRACLPIAPVHGRVLTHSDGSALFRWTRRSRSGWVWSDAVDAPLAEEVERYRISIAPDVGPDRTIEASVPEWTYSAVERAADIASGATAIIIAVRQVGDHGLSPPLSIQFSLT